MNRAVQLIRTRRLPATGLWLPMGPQGAESALPVVLIRLSA
jgi:hypothetical protein